MNNQEINALINYRLDQASETNQEEMEDFIQTLTSFIKTRDDLL
jgi:hypothetical protein